MKKKNILKYLKTLQSQFEEKTREGGAKFWCLKEKDYDKYLPIVRAIHGVEILPDDFRYSTIVGLIDNLLNYSYDSLDLESHLENYKYEIIDNEVSIYNSDLREWFARSHRSAEYCDEAAQNYGVGSGDGFNVMNLIKQGQYSEIEEIYGNLERHLLEICS